MNSPRNHPRKDEGHDAHAQGVTPTRRARRDEIMAAALRAAVANHVLPVIAQGLALRDPHALRAPVELRAVAAGSLAP